MSVGWNKPSGWSVSLTATVWGASLLAVLQIQYLPLGASHAVCGPWGCGPPLPPLIAYHGFWIVLLSLPTGVACRNLRTSALRKAGWGLLSVGFAGLLLVGLWDLIPSLPHWLPRVQNLAPKFYVRRYLLSVATLVDVPLVPLILAGVCCLLAARGKAPAKSEELHERFEVSIATARSHGDSDSSSESGLGATERPQRDCKTTETI